jgi:hypothetical protein
MVIHCSNPQRFRRVSSWTRCSHYSSGPTSHRSAATAWAARLGCFSSAAVDVSYAAPQAYGILNVAQNCQSSTSPGVFSRYRIYIFPREK